MASVNTYRRIADKARAIPGKFGLREHSVSIVKTSWTGGRTGYGDKIVEETPLLVNGQNPKVRFPNQRDVALGLMSFGTITIGPLTPNYGAGGIDRDLVASQELESSGTLLLRVTGPQHPNGAQYRIQTVNVDRALRVTFVCVSVTGN